MKTKPHIALMRDESVEVDMSVYEILDIALSALQNIEDVTKGHSEMRHRAIAHDALTKIRSKVTTATFKSSPKAKPTIAKPSKSISRKK